MPFFTNRGAKLFWGYLLNGVTLPTNLYFALLTNDVAPTVDTNVMSDLVEIAAGNGYTAGGLSLSLNATDFPSLTEDDVNDLGSILIKDVVFTASGGSMPISGSAARFGALTDDNVTVADRQIFYVCDLGGDKVVTSGNSLTISLAKLVGSTV